MIPSVVSLVPFFLKRGRHVVLPAVQPMANLKAGDTISCFYPNTKPRYARGKDGWRRWGAPLRLEGVPQEVHDSAALKRAAAVHDAVNAAGSADPKLYGWKSLKLWQIAVGSAGDRAGAPLPSLPAGGAVLCGVDRFGGRGAVLHRNYFHDLVRKRIFCTILY